MCDTRIMMEVVQEDSGKITEATEGSKEQEEEKVMEKRTLQPNLRGLILSPRQPAGICPHMVV